MATTAHSIPAITAMAPGLEPQGADQQENYAQVQPSAISGATSPSKDSRDSADLSMANQEHEESNTLEDEQIEDYGAIGDQTARVWIFGMKVCNKT